METHFKHIYIGKLIKAKVEEQHLTRAEFARMIHCARTSLYHIFNSKNIDVERLLLISKVLNYDFIKEVYLKGELLLENESQEEQEVGPHIVLPIRNKEIDVSELPDEILQLIKEKVNRIE